DQRKLLDLLLGMKRKEFPYLGRRDHASEQGDGPAVHFAGEQIMVVSTSGSLLKLYLDRKPPPHTSGSLAGPLARPARKSMTVAAQPPPEETVKDWAKSVPPRFDKLRPLLQFRSVILALDLKPRANDDAAAAAFDVDLQLGYADPDRARQAETAAHTTTGPS